MSVKSPACRLLIEQLLRTPTSSMDYTIDHAVAEFVTAHTDTEVLDLVYVMLDEDPPGSREYELACELWPFVQLAAMHQVAAALVAEAVQS